MPTYEYSCPNGHEFELFQKMSDKPGAKCPVCGRAGVRRISGGAGLVFKGSGFYITDYGKDGKGPRKDPTESKPEPKADVKAGSASEATSGSTSEPKPKPKAKPSKGGE